MEQLLAVKRVLESALEHIQAVKRVAMQRSCKC